MKHTNMRITTIKALLFLCVVSTTSCKKYVDINIADNLIAKENAFTTDASATSAVLGVYSWYPTIYSQQYFTWLGGILSDDLQYTGTVAEYLQFAQANVLNNNSTNESYLWGYPYQVIREANLAIDGITKSTGMTTAGKAQLLGEAKFLRAFIFFNLVNFFGEVPLSLDPVELNNAFLPRSSVDAVYAQIITDLKEAENSLPATYAGTASLKVRVNKWAAAALLARVYLYRKDYPNAEAEATKVIGSGVYTMSTLATTFQNTSTETILQMFNTTGASSFGSNYRTTSSANNVAPPTYALHTSVVNSFEVGDNRRVSWVDSTTSNSVKYYRINKYKLVTATAGNEYNVLLRLAEQYLIRAEARAKQSNISGAQDDINAVRSRAGLGNTPAASTTDLVAAVAQERKVELFGEFAHRWFDLKRTEQANAVLAPLKSNWKATAVLMPVPYSQRLLNTNLSQNDGYQ